MMQRIVFSIDDRSLESLKHVQERGNFSSIAAAIRESIEVSEALQNQVAEGYSEIVVRNKKAKKEKILVIPSLEKLGKCMRTPES